MDDHAHVEVEAVHDELACEDEGALFGGEERLHVDEVVQELAEVGLADDGLADELAAGDVVGDYGVLLDHGADVGERLGRGNFAETGQVEAVELVRVLAAGPVAVGGDGGLERGPLGFGDGVLVAGHGRAERLEERGEVARAVRVHAFIEVQDAGRIGGRERGLFEEVLDGCGVVGVEGVLRDAGPGVLRTGEDEGVAAVEIVVDVRGDGTAGLPESVRGGLVGEELLLAFDALVGPGEESLQHAFEGVELGGADAVRAGDVLLRSGGGHGEADAVGGERVLHGFRRDDAVAVLKSAGDEFLEFVDLFDRDGGVGIRADALQRELGGLLRAFPVGIVGVQRGEAERGRGGDEIGEVGDRGDDPFEEGADVLHMDAAGCVLRDQGEEIGGAEKVSGRDAGQRPVRRIELVGVAEVVRGLDDELGGPADATEFHGGRGLAGFFRIVHDGVSPGFRLVSVSFETEAMSGSAGSPVPEPAGGGRSGRRPTAAGWRRARPRRTGDG